MKRRNLTYGIILILFALAACEPLDKELLRGDLIGSVMVYDQFHNLQGDCAGVQVELRADEFQAEKISSTDGEFIFENLSYGNYAIRHQKEGYVGNYGGNKQVHHLGGYSPTRITLSLYEIPTYGMHIDSAHIDEQYGLISLWIHLSAWSGNPEGFSTFRCFVGEVPEISSEVFDHARIGYFHHGEVSNDRIEAYTHEIYFENPTADSLYLIVYPQARGQGYYDYLPASLGPPSNVLAVKNPFKE